ncbi:hypothetical protein [Streptomyces sp. GbtcB6]|uniref:hypothetical protein n=1 Tax=Streptomyces sp. GbtcB6 TaxID=2824751 RepID=UPI001C2F79A8|nr:hypothetical protein [Streptomyces sp. GbtcB6]
MPDTGGAHALLTVCEGSGAQAFARPCEKYADSPAGVPGTPPYDGFGPERPPLHRELVPRVPSPHGRTGGRA